MALLLAPLAAYGEIAGQATGKSGVAPVLRGRERPVRSAPAISIVAQPGLPPEIASRLTTSPVAPLTTTTSLSFGGAECRRSCAQDLYFCRADRDEVDCNPVWTRCVVACPEGSSSLP